MKCIFKIKFLIRTGSSEPAVGRSQPTEKEPDAIDCKVYFLDALAFNNKKKKGKKELSSYNTLSSVSASTLEDFFLYS